MDVLSETKQKALDVAEVRMREKGYKAISFRDIADALGIRSASLHYHFPSKADLGEALVWRYTDAFRSRLEAKVTDQTTDKATDQARQAVSSYIQLHRDALGSNCHACLCVMLSAEAHHLPAGVSHAVEDFIAEHLGWLTDWFETLTITPPTQRAQAALAQLQGGMLLAALMKDPSLFDAAAEALWQSLERS